MAFLVQNLVRRYSSPTGITEWEYCTTDALSTVQTLDYFSQAALPGMFATSDTINIYIYTSVDIVGRFHGLQQYCRGIVTGVDGIAATVTVDIWDTSGSDAIEFVFDGGGSALTTGYKGTLQVPWACTIVGYRLLVDASATITFDIRKCTYTQYDAGVTHPASGDAIVGAAPPAITAGVKTANSVLTGWTTALLTGDFLFFYISANDSAKLATLSLEVAKS